MPHPAARSSGVVTGFRVISAGSCAVTTAHHSMRATAKRRIEWKRSISSAAARFRWLRTPLPSPAQFAPRPATSRMLILMGHRVEQTAWKPKPAQKRGILYRLLRYLVAAALGFYALAAMGLLALRSVNPPFTAVQMERRGGFGFHQAPHPQNYKFVSLPPPFPHFHPSLLPPPGNRLFPPPRLSFGGERQLIPKKQ